MKFQTTARQKALIAAWVTFGILYGLFIVPMQMGTPDLAGASGAAVGMGIFLGFISYSYYYYKWKKAQK